jgi:hypothetical protein
VAPEGPVDPEQLYRVLLGQDHVTRVSHPGFDAVLVPWSSGPEKETVCHGSSPEVLR